MRQAHLIRSLFAVLFLALMAAPASASIKVTNTADFGGGSLRQAITTANGTVAADTIEIKVTGTIELGSALPELSTDMTIQGSGTRKLIVKRDTGGDYRIFTVGPGAVVKISGLTATQGNVTGTLTQGGGIYNAGDLKLKQVAVVDNAAAASTPDMFGMANSEGGGIYSTGTLKLDRSTVGDNNATATGGMGGLSQGGGVSNHGTVTIDYSTVSDNSSQYAAGALNLGGTMDVRASTISGNTAQVGHGGLDNQTGQITITASTLADNDAASQGANLTNAGVGGNVVTLQDTIISDPRTGDNCANFATITSNGYNLSSDATCGLDQDSDQTNTEPLLKDLGGYGGPTETMALKSTSPAIDQGIAAGLTTDQRGQARPFNSSGIPKAPGGDNSDIGAFERQS
jgi:hypothetical protein